MRRLDHFYKYRCYSYYAYHWVGFGLIRVGSEDELSLTA